MSPNLSRSGRSHRPNSAIAVDGRSPGETHPAASIRAPSRESSLPRRATTAESAERGGRHWSRDATREGRSRRPRRRDQPRGRGRPPPPPPRRRRRPACRRDPLARSAKKALGHIAQRIIWAEQLTPSPTTPAPPAPAAKTKPHQAPASTAPSPAAAPSTTRQVSATQPAAKQQAAPADEQERKARDKRWEALPAAAQDEARARFDQLEPSRKGAPSAQCFDQVVDDVENLVTKTYNDEEYQLLERRKWHPTDKNGDELMKRARIDALGINRKPVTLREQGAVLDAADRGFENAKHQVEKRGGITPSHASVRAAAAAASTLTTYATGWLRKVIDAIASGKAKPVYDDPGPESENTQIRQKCIGNNRAVKKRAADEQHAQAMKNWESLGTVMRRFTREPERPEPEDPDPPTQKQITAWRSHVVRWAREGITAAAEYCKRKIPTADHLTHYPPGCAASRTDARPRPPSHPTMTDTAPMPSGPLDCGAGAISTGSVRDGRRALQLVDGRWGTGRELRARPLRRVAR